MGMPWIGLYSYSALSINMEKCDICGNPLTVNGPVVTCDTCGYGVNHYIRSRIILGDDFDER